MALLCGCFVCVNVREHDTVKSKASFDVFLNQSPRPFRRLYRINHLNFFTNQQKEKEHPNFNYFNTYMYKDICRSDHSQTSKYLQPVHVSSISSTISLAAYFILRFWLSESLVHLTPIRTTKNFIVYSSVEQNFTCKYDFWE